MMVLSFVKRCRCNLKLNKVSCVGGHTRVFRTPTLVVVVFPMFILLFLSDWIPPLSSDDEIADVPQPWTAVFLLRAQTSLTANLCSHRNTCMKSYPSCLILWLLRWCLWYHPLTLYVNNSLGFHRKRPRVRTGGTLHLSVSFILSRTARRMILSKHHGIAMVNSL